MLGPSTNTDMRSSTETAVHCKSTFISKLFYDTGDQDTGWKVQRPAYGCR